MSDSGLGEDYQRGKDDSIKELKQQVLEILEDAEDNPKQTLVKLLNLILNLN